MHLMYILNNSYYALYNGHYQLCLINLAQDYP